MNPRIKKWVVRPIAILLATVIVLVTIGVILLTAEQERLVNIGVSDINEQFIGELTIDKSSISPFRHFPFVSIALHNARLYPDKSKKSAPIFEIEKLYIGFSLPDIFQKKYNVRKLSIQNGHLDLVSETDGHLNLLEAMNVHGDTTASTTASAFEVKLQNIVCKNIKVSYLDSVSLIKYSSSISDMTTSFAMDSIASKIKVNGEMELDILGLRDSTMFRHRKLGIDLAAIYKTKEQHLEIDEGLFKLQEASFDVSGTADFAGDHYVDLKMKGKEPDITMLAAFLPGDIKKILKPFKYDGQIFFDGSIKGKITKDDLPLIQVSFGCKNAWFLNTTAGKKVDQLNFKGFYTNGAEHKLKTSQLHLINVTAHPENGIFKGNFIIEDFEKPRTLVQVSSEIELKFLGDFFGIKNLQQTTGKIKLEMDFKDLNNIRIPERSLNKLKEGIQSKLEVEGLGFKIPGYPHPITNMNLQAEMKDGKITMDSTSFQIGASDFRLDGTISDIQGFLRDREKPITLTFDARSKKVVLNELLSYDTALAAKYKDEEIHAFNIGLMFQTSVQQLLHPSPLPQGDFTMKHLSASFKKYPHALNDVSGTVRIHDTTLVLVDLNGKIDNSDLKMSGRIRNYAIWFADMKKGRTQIALDFKSTRFAMADILDPMTRKYIPRGYRKEEASNVSLQATVDLRYDTTFRFAKAEITNITGLLKKHDLRLRNVHGKLKYGANNIVVLDTMKGIIGHSDFDVSMRFFYGKDKKLKKKHNYLEFHSEFLDADELSSYSLSSPPPKQAPGAPRGADTTSHASSFNIFTLPFSEFNAQLTVTKLRYHAMWIKNAHLALRMQEDHHIFLDTVGMGIADGTIGLKGVLDGTNADDITFKSTIDVEHVNLEKILIKLDHMGEDIVINKNIKGMLTGQIKSDIHVHPNLMPIMTKTKADLNVKVFKGSLVDFAPMQAMAGYFKDKNLRMILFDTLQNEFSFASGVLTIPTMNINSSLGYIQMSGKQSMDLNMEYYVRVPLKLVTQAGFNSLFNRKPEEVDLNQVDAIDYSEKDKKVRFMNLKVTGKPEDFKVALGKDKNKKYGKK